MQKKKKVLFVVYYFIQAGGERYTYEIARALDKEKFDLHFLKIYPLRANTNWANEYYYQPTLNLGCTIDFYETILNQCAQIKQAQAIEKLTRYIPVGRWQAAASHQLQKAKTTALENYLNQFDIVNWMGNGIYAHVASPLRKGNYDEYIHLLSTQFQYDYDVYANWDKSKFYHFVSPFSPWLLEQELKPFLNYRHTYFPMSLTLAPYEVQRKHTINNPYTIAIFSRIDRLKPMEPYLYALKLITEQGLDVQLHIYGAGDPVQTGLKRQIEHLYITDRVIFKGHAESIEAVMKTGEIDLVWFQSGNNRPAGFAAFEIAMSGVPQVFWDFGYYVPEPEYNAVYPSYTHLSGFVNHSAKLLMDDHLRYEQGKLQQKFVLEHQDIYKNIEILEKTYLNS